MKSGSGNQFLYDLQEQDAAPAIGVVGPKGDKINDVDDYDVYDSDVKKKSSSTKRGATRK